MNHRLISFIAFVWFFGQLFSLMVEGNFTGSTESGVLNDIGIFNQVEQVGEGGVVNFAKTTPDYLGGLLGMLTWDYSYLQGEMGFLRYILMVFSIGFVAILMALFISAVQGLFSAVRGVLG